MPKHPPIARSGDPTFKPSLWSRRNMAQLYDTGVIHGTYPWLWNCHWSVPAQLYAQTITPQSRVLDIGPGSGYFLDHLDMPNLDLHLLDRYQGSLDAAADRLARYRPKLYTGDALEPFPLHPGAVDVVVLGMVLHCVRGKNIAEKAKVFDHIRALLAPGGVCIGYAVLSQGVQHSSAGRVGLRYLNTRGVFCNTGDSLTDLSTVLHTHFDEVRLAVVGSVALWQVTVR